MKKHFLLILAAVLVGLCATATAASLPYVGDSLTGRVQIGYVTDSTGARVDTLTDSNTTTTWTQPLGGEGPDLTLTLYGASVGEIWLRNGHCYSQNYYNHHDRPSMVTVTLWYNSGRYTTDSVTYRYRLTDAFRPNTVSAGWNSGYQRLLLPKRVDGVNRIELTIDSVVVGYGRTGATMTDIAVTRGQHATATPDRSTATPRPQKAYITATPGPTQSWVESITPEPEVEIIIPTREVVILRPEATREAEVDVITPRPTQSLVERITPRPTQSLVEVITPRPTQPLVEYLTPVPTAEPVFYPTQGIIATLNQRMATRTGPSNMYEEIGNFFGDGDQVNVIGKCQDNKGLWWYHVEFKPKNSDDWMRGYTPARRTNIDPETAPVPLENTNIGAFQAVQNTRLYYGPGEEYRMYTKDVLEAGTPVQAYMAYEGWLQINFYVEKTHVSRWCWVPANVMIPIASYK